MNKKTFTKRAACVFSAFMAILLLALSIPAFDLTVLAAEKASDEKYSDGLPVLNITTDDGQLITSKTEYKPGKVNIELNDYYKDYTSALTSGDVSMEIRCRGNSTYSMPDVSRLGKFSYKLKLDEKADLFGMGESKHWVLLANFYEPTFLRNKMAYELARMLGVAYCDSVFVVLYLNGEYRGLYQLCESIRIAEDRVDIQDYEEIAEDISKSFGRAHELSNEAAEWIEDAMTTNLAWITSGVFSLEYKISNYFDLSKSDLTTEEGIKKAIGNVTVAIKKKDRIGNAGVEAVSAIMNSDRDWIKSGTIKGFDVTKYYDMSTIDLTSGYLIEYDAFLDKRAKFTTSAGVPLMVDGPEYLDTNTELFNYVKNLAKDFEEAVYADDFVNSKGKHYSEYLDVQSMVDFFLVQMIVANGEFGIRSMYFYIDKGKIVWGPVWDVDCGGGNHMTVSTDPKVWNGFGNRNHWYQELYGDPYFTALIQKRWAEIQPVVENYESALDLYYQYIKAAANRDCKKWGLHGSWGNNEITRPFEEEYDFYNGYVSARLDWMEETFASPSLNIGGKGLSKNEKITLSLADQSGSALGSATDEYFYTNYVYNPNGSNGITMKFTTRHTTLVKIGLYINGRFYKTFEANDDKAYQFDIPKDAFDLTEGATNVITVYGYNHDNAHYSSSFINFTTSYLDKSKVGYCTVTCGDYYTVVKKGSTITVPTIVEDALLMSATSFTYGKDKTVKCGEALTVNSDIDLKVKWDRNDDFSVLLMSEVDSLDYTFSANDSWSSLVGARVSYEGEALLDCDKELSIVGTQEYTKDGKTFVRVIALQKLGAVEAARITVKINGKDELSIEADTLYGVVYGGEKAYAPSSGYYFTATFEIPAEGEASVSAIPVVTVDGESVSGEEKTVTYKDSVLVN